MDARDQAPLRQDLIRPGSSTRATAVPDAGAFMDWAEVAYGGFFPSGQSNQTSAPYIYRYYPETGNYLGVAGQDIYIYGPLSAYTLYKVGTLADYAADVLAPVEAISDVQAARFLLHCQFSASDAEIAAVRSLGYAKWLTRQFHTPSSQGGWDWLVAKGYSRIDSNTYFFTDYPGDYMAWYQLLASPDAVRRRWALALSEFFVVSLAGLTLNWAPFAIAHHWDNLCQHAFGNYRQLLEAVTRSPAMGAYLNIIGSQKEDPVTGRQPDENYAREVMQLFSIGLTQLNLDGTPQLGPDGRPLPTYTQEDVSQLARVFTGYDLDDSVGTFNSPVTPFARLYNVEQARRPLVLDESKHSTEDIRFLGTVIPAGTPGAEALRMALDTLHQHPNVGPFLGRQMIQRLVTSQPSPAYVARVAAAFNDNGAGARGDLRAVLRAIVLDPEARGEAGLSAPTFGKLREPMLRFAQWARTFDVRSLRGTWKVGRPTYSAEYSLGQSPLVAPSVFNFFRPGYVPPSTALAATQSTAPEFQIVNESSVSAYVNFMETVVYQGMTVRAPERPEYPANPTATDGPDIAPDYTTELALAPDTTALVARLNRLLCAGQLSSATISLITTALRADNLTSQASTAFRRIHVARAVLMVMCAADYLVQK